MGPARFVQRGKIRTKDLCFRWMVCDWAGEVEAARPTWADEPRIQTAQTNHGNFCRRSGLRESIAALNKESRGCVDPFFSASSSRKTLADLRLSFVMTCAIRSCERSFLSSGSGLTANRKNRSTPRDPILPSTIRSCSPRPAGCYRPLPRPPSTCLRARDICHSLRP